MIVRLLPDAEAEVQQQELWYWRRSESTAQGFMAALDRGLSLIAESPELGRKYRRGTRRLVLTSLPFSIVYRVEPEAIYVVAVAHAKLRPGYWHARVSG